MFTRKYKFWRYLNPINIIGNILGYGNCDCGNTLYRTNNPGYQLNNYRGRCICNECYKDKRDDIDRHNHAILSEPMPIIQDKAIGIKAAIGVEYGKCQDKDCEWHKKDNRFIYINEMWTLREECISDII